MTNDKCGEYTRSDILKLLQQHVISRHLLRSRGVDIHQQTFIDVSARREASPTFIGSTNCQTDDTVTAVTVLLLPGRMTRQCPGCVSTDKAQVIE